MAVYGIALLFMSHPVAAQGLGGGSGIAAENSLGARKHHDYAGKACLETSGVAHPLASNPKILNHAVSIDNHCADRIKVKVCYYRSDECSDVEVPGYSRKEQIIGVFPAMQEFRYEVREQF